MHGFFASLRMTGFYSWLLASHPQRIVDFRSSTSHEDLTKLIDKYVGWEENVCASFLASPKSDSPSSGRNNRRGELPWDKKNKAAEIGAMCESRTVEVSHDETTRS
jgi:hypothetical protein